VANLDLLEWFDDEEREDCPACGVRTLVGARRAPLLRVCLSCAGVWVGGVRVDQQGRLEGAPD
jgi:Zn-finger nucleic acid-binding protein